MDSIFGVTFGDEIRKIDYKLYQGMEYESLNIKEINDLNKLIVKVDQKSRICKVTAVFNIETFDEVDEYINFIKKDLYNKGFKTKKENIMISNKMFLVIDVQEKNIIINIWHTEYSLDYKDIRNKYNVKQIGIFDYLIGEYNDPKIKFSNITSNKYGINDYVCIIYNIYKGLFIYNLEALIISKNKKDRDNNINLIKKYLINLGMGYQSTTNIIFSNSPEKNIVNSHMHYLGNPSIVCVIEEKQENEGEYLTKVVMKIDDFIFDKKLIGTVHHNSRLSAFGHIFGEELYENKKNEFFGWGNNDVKETYLNLIQEDNKLKYMEVEIKILNNEAKNKILLDLIKDLDDSSFTLKSNLNNIKSYKNNSFYVDIDFAKENIITLKIEM